MALVVEVVLVVALVAPPSRNVTVVVVSVPLPLLLPSDSTMIVALNKYEINKQTKEKLVKTIVVQCRQIRDIVSFKLFGREGGDKSFRGGSAE